MFLALVELEEDSQILGYINVLWNLLSSHLLWLNKFRYIICSTYLFSPKHLRSLSHLNSPTEEKPNLMRIDSYADYVLVGVVQIFGVPSK